MGRKSTSEARLNEIRQYVKGGHTYDEAVNLFKCGKTTVMRAVNPEAYWLLIQKQSTTKRLIIAAVTLQKIKAKGFIVSYIKDNKINVTDSKTGLSITIEDKVYSDKGAKK